MQTEKRYDVKFCSCGRIHVMPFDEIDWLLEDYKNRFIIRICAHCGVADVTFLTDNYDNGYDINCCNLEPIREWNNTKIYYSEGIRVYMMTDKEADTYQCDYFTNSEEWDYDCSQVSLDYAYKEKMDFVTVDTQRLIEDVKRKYKDDADAILKSISGYAVKIHWSGTDYEKDWNK